MGGVVLGAWPAEGELATYPLLCAADPEPGLQPFVPPALALAPTHRPDLARPAGALAGMEARSLGLHLLLAPTLDV